MLFSYIQSGILNHYGNVPEPECDYWKLPNGPSWTWWILAIMPLDSQIQVCVYGMGLKFTSTYYLLSNEYRFYYSYIIKNDALPLI